MNKVHSIVLLSLAFACVKADEGVKLDAINLERVVAIKTAIKESDLAHVKAMWRRIDTLVESADEKVTILKSLIDSASKTAQDSKESVASSAGGRDYKKVVAGSLLCAGVFAGILFLNPLAPFYEGGTQGEKIRGVVTLTGLMAASRLGGYLIQTGWGVNAEQIPSGGRSQAAIIEAYLEDRLQELLAEKRK